MSKKHLKNHDGDGLHANLLYREQQMEWDVPELRSAQSRLAQVCERLHLPQNVLEKLSFPKRAVVSSVPIRLDNGQTRVFPGYVVDHSETLGPCQGQLRYHRHANLGEISALAMSHTWKSALLGIPLGGAQGGVRCDPDLLSQRELQAITRRFTTEMVPVIGPDRLILSPGLGTNEQTMAWVMDTYSQMRGSSTRQIVTGKPRIIGGSLGRKDAPGKSVVFFIYHTFKKLNRPLGADVEVAIQGFGKLGQSAFRKLSKMGCRIIAVNDIRGGVYNKHGLDYEDLLAHVKENKFVAGYPKGETITNEELLTLPCDILIPAATGNQITIKNAPHIRAKMIVEGAHEVIALAAERILTERNILVIPDILASSGSVVISYFEWVQGLQSLLWSQKEITRNLFRILYETFHRVHATADAQKVDLRTAALMAGVKRVADAMLSRGLYP